MDRMLSVLEILTQLVQLATAVLGLVKLLKKSRTRK
jgi:hypothetical protein